MLTIREETMLEIFSVAIRQCLLDFFVAVQRKIKQICELPTISHSFDAHRPNRNNKLLKYWIQVFLNFEQ